MLLTIRSISLWCAALSIAVFSASPAPKGPLTSFFSHSSKSHRAPSPHRGLAKRAADPVYAKTGATNFSNTGTLSAPVWTLSSRDTIIYDGSGNEILSISSRARNGWSRDSLSDLDSTVYLNGKVVETVRESFDSGTVSSGSRTTVGYLNGDGTIIKTYYNWDELAQTWKVNTKDSLVFSAAAAAVITSGISDWTSLTGIFAWTYDTSRNTWSNENSWTKTKAECTATMLVLTEKSLLTPTDSVDLFKESRTFSSPVWIENNMTQEVTQRKDQVTGNFVNFSKETYDINANGYKLGYRGFEWDTLKSDWTQSYYSFDFPDALGNDTLEISAFYIKTAAIWDTNYMERDTRTYDADGNNTVIISSSYSTNVGAWSLDAKTINTFALINSSVKAPLPQAVLRNIVVKVTPTTIIFSGRDLEGLDLYNAAGCFVLSVRQKPSALLSLNLTNGASPVRAGVYIARLLAASGKSTIRLAVCR